MNTLNNSLDKILHGQKEISCEPLIEYLDDLNKQNHAELNNLKSKYLYSRNLKYRNVLKNIDLIISEKLEQVDKIKNSYKNNAELDNLKKNFKYQLDDLLNQIEVLRTRKSRIEKILEKTIENKNNVTFHKNLEDLIHFYKAFLIYSKTGDKNSYLEETRKINPNGNIIIYHISILFNFFIGEKKYINLNVFFKKYFSFQNIFKSLLLTPSISPETLKINKSPFINYEENNIGLENNQMLKNLKFFKIKPTYEKLDIEINLLLNQMYIVNILSNLLVDFNDKNERKVSHYTSTLVAENLVTDEFKIRLNMTDLMNDPTEGKILYNLLNINILETLHHSTFLTCFTFNHNSLNQFRLYGLTNNVPCSGISVVFNNDFFYKLNDIDQDHIFDVNKLPLFRCVYIDDFSGHIEVAKRNRFTFFQEHKDKSTANKNWNTYINSINKIENNILSYIDEIKKINQNLLKNKNYELLKIINNTIKPLAFLFKHFAFQEEQECRILKIQSIENDEVVIDSNMKTTYINYENKCNKYIKNLYIGIESKDIKNPLIKKLKEKQLLIPKTTVSENPFFYKK